MHCRGFLFFLSCPRVGVATRCVCNVSASQGSGFASHTVSTQDGFSHVAHNVNVFSSRKKSRIFSMKMDIFIKRTPLTRTSKNQHGHKHVSFLEKNCILNAEGPNLACQLKPNPACQVCQALFRATKRLILHDTLYAEFLRFLELRVCSCLRAVDAARAGSWFPPYLSATFVFVSLTLAHAPSLAWSVEEVCNC